MTGIRDRLWLPDNAEKELVEGRVCLEVFDERTGKLKDRAESTNYVTDILISAIQYTARGFMRGWIPGGSGVSNTDVGPSYGTMGFWLTTATSAANASGDRIIRGGMVAYATDSSYTGTSLYRGTLNANESSMTPTKIVFVVDWPTNAGIGSIGSVYATSIVLYSFYGSLSTAYGDQYSAGTYGSSWTDSTTGLPSGGSQAGGLWMDPDGTHYWSMWTGPATGQATMVQRVIGTGVISTSVSCTGMTVTPYGFTNDGVGSVGNWWFNDTSLNLRKYPAAGAASPTATYTGQIPSNGYGYMCFGGGYIYIHRTQSPTLVDQYSPSTGGFITTITLAQELDQNYAGLQAGPIAYLADATNGDTLYVPCTAPSYVSGNNFASLYSTSGGAKGNYLPVFIGNTGMGFTPAGVVMLYNGAQTSYLLSNTRSFYSRSVLGSPITKTGTQTMKLTYEYDYS